MDNAPISEIFLYRAAEQYQWAPDITSRIQAIPPLISQRLWARNLNQFVFTQNVIESLESFKYEF